MRRMVYLLALALTVPMIATAQTQFQDAANAKLTGVVVEFSCYMNEGAGKALAPEHQTCALDCVKQGKPLAIATETDGLRKIVGNMSKDNFAKMTPWIGKRVVVTGETLHDAFSARFIDVKTIAAAK